MIKIPVYDTRELHILDVVNFIPNLNVRGPRYNNEGCNMGLCRSKNGKLIVMYQHEEFPSCDKAFYISEEEGYELCLSRGKQYLVEKLEISPSY